MKGRITSFQRFGSVLGTTGSVVGKSIRSLKGSLKDGRDSEGANENQIDYSDNKGIYNMTLKSNEMLQFDFEEEDLGEEVYGCIASPFGDSSTIEKDAQTAIKGRKTPLADSPHFKDNKRKWYYKKGKTEFEDCVAIPQENVPLAVNSKFEMKYWESKINNTQSIPKGIGFTSGALVRPIAFSDKAVPIQDGYRGVEQDAGWWDFSTAYSNSIIGRAQILRGVPLSTAHQIINCCKEIVLTGTIDRSITRKNKKCTTWDGSPDGPDKTQRKWAGEQLVGCPPGSCRNIGGKTELQCASSQLTTTMKLSGKFDMTAYRHKQVSKIWAKKEGQNTLDISGNSFLGCLEDAALTKWSASTCEPAEDSGPNPVIPDPTIKQVYTYERQTKLSSGCLAYPYTNNSMIIRDEEDNLKTQDLDIALCEPDTGKTYYFLNGTAQLPRPLSGSWWLPPSYPGGTLFRSEYNSDTAVRPLYESGPRLQCYFHGVGWDHSKVGKDGPEVPWEKDDCGNNPVNFHDWKMEWNTTGIKTTVDGLCGLGFGNVDNYDNKLNTCECEGETCGKCMKVLGDLKLTCQCQPKCGTLSHNSENPCSDGHKNKNEKSCDGVYGISFTIGKYVGVHDDSYDSDSYGKTETYRVSPVPLSTKAESGAKEDLTMWFSGYVSDIIPYYGGTSDLEVGLYANENSADIELRRLKENSVVRYEKRNVGALTVLCGDWNNAFPLWVILRIQKETSCKTPPSSWRVEYNRRCSSMNMQGGYELGAPRKQCNECQDGACCDEGGCAGVAGQDPCCNDVTCGVDNPCALAISCNGNPQACDENQEITCDATCAPIDSSGECGCCGCSYAACDHSDDDCFTCCPDYVSCNPFQMLEEYEDLSCYGEALEEEKHEMTLDLQIEFKLFTEME